MVVDNVHEFEGSHSAFDYRLIRTAVVGARDSTEPVFLPQDYAGATDVLRRNRGEGFYCGLLLGGCGWPLRIWRSRHEAKVAHFAHRPNGPVCTRYDAHDADADHLYIYNGLVFLARRHTRSYGMTSRNDISFGRSGCDSVLIQSDASAVRVQFADLAEEVWRFEDGRLQRSFENIQWIFGLGAGSAAKALKARDGYVLRARCELREGTRQVLVRMETPNSESPWIPLEECYITEDGTVTATRMLDYYPDNLQERMSEVLHAAESSNVEAGTPSHHPDVIRTVIGELTDSMSRDDYERAAEVRNLHLDSLARLTDMNMTAEIKEYRIFMRWYVNHPVYRNKLAVERVIRRAQKKDEISSRQKEISKPTSPKRRTSKVSRRKTSSEPQLDHFEQSVDLILRRIARQQKTITLAEIPGARFEDRKSMARVLAAIERASDESAVMLTALIVDRDRKYDRIFRDVLNRLGYVCPSSEFSIQMAWKVELERTHARYATPRRPLPPRLLRRKTRPK